MINKITLEVHTVINNLNKIINILPLVSLLNLQAEKSHLKSLMYVPEAVTEEKWMQSYLKSCVS